MVSMDEMQRMMLLRLGEMDASTTATWHLQMLRQWIGGRTFLSRRLKSLVLYESYSYDLTLYA